MHAGKNYKFREFVQWTRRDIFQLTVLATIPTLLYQLLDMHWIAIPWLPVALIGTAAAFIVGFKNTQTYNRLWEARQIWGSIVNGSRTWGIMVRDFIKADKATSQKLIQVHLAWLCALRFQLRKPQQWETQDKPHNREFHAYFSVPEWKEKIEVALAQYLDADDLGFILAKKNRATQLISLQSANLAQLKKQGLIDPYEYVELERRLADFYDQQGKCERIKNFPYPRQFATINLFFVRLFVILLPFGILKEFEKLGPQLVWLAIPFSVIVAWVFTSMEKVGEATENPFEGGANDVPITALSRVIEIDLLEMLDEENIPDPLAPVNNILM